MSKKKSKKAPDTGAESTNEPAARPRTKQTYIPGTEPPSIPDLDDAMEAYQDTKCTRCKWSQKETVAYDNMLAIAESNRELINKLIVPNGKGIRIYKSDHLKLEIQPETHKLKVSPITEADIAAGNAPKDTTEGEA